ncbi:unnamed protein product [Ixodes hexagonus]
MNDNGYPHACFPRCEYKTRFAGTSAFDMSDPDYWGTYFRSTASDRDSDRLSQLRSKDYQNSFTNAPKTTPVLTGTFHSPWQHKQYKAIFHTTPEVPKAAHEQGGLYDLLLSRRRDTCLRVERRFNETEFADKKLDVYFANEYPCVMVKIEAFNDVSKEASSLYEIAIAYFVAMTNKIAHSKNIPIELVIRSSFGHNNPNVAEMITSLRINVGIIPEAYEEVLVKSLIELNDKFLVPLINSIFHLNRAQIKNDKEGVTRCSDHNKYKQKPRPLSSWSANEPLFKVLTKVEHFRGRKVSDQVMSKKKHVDLLANYVCEELDQSQPNLASPLIKIMGQLFDSKRKVLNVADDAYQKVSMRGFPNEENPEIKEDVVFWRIMREIALRLVVKCTRELSEAIEARELAGLYSTLEKANLEFVRNSGYQEAQDGCGSDSDCEVHGVPTFYSKKVTVATGMRAISFAQFLSIYHLRQLGFNPRTKAEKMYFETEEATRSVSDIYDLLGLHKNEKQHQGDATIRYVDLNYCAVAGPESVTLRGVLNKVSRNDVVVFDYTSADTEKIRMSVNSLIAKVDVIFLVSSGLKNEQLGADMNPYGTIRIVAKDRGTLNALYFVLGAVLEAAGEILPKQLHSIRKAYKNAGAVVTNAALYKRMCRK